MVLAGEVSGRKTHRRAEVFIGCQDFAAGGELDHRHDAADRLNHGCIVDCQIATAPDHWR